MRPFFLLSFFFFILLILICFSVSTIFHTQAKQTQKTFHKSNFPLLTPVPETYWEKKTITKETKTQADASSPTL